MSDESALTRLTTLYKELRDQQINPDVDYTKRGMEKLVSEASRAAAFAARSSAIQAQARLIRRQLERDVEAVKYNHQDRYDEAVVKYAALYERLSWEERGSKYRDKTRPTLELLRLTEIRLAEAVAVIEAIDILARSIQRARYDLSAIMEGLRFAERLGEAT